MPIRVIIIGGGISGIAQAIRLRDELGDKVQITIIEKKGSPGGVWRDSLWPESAVDIPIHLYSLSDNLNPSFPQIYATQPEVLAYWEGLIDKYGLRPLFVFHTEFSQSFWHEDRQVHSVTVRNLQTGSLVDLEAEVLISATGPLAKRKFPQVPGLESFKGPWFHNLDWDASVDLKGKRVAVVGNGSSGVQIVPGLAKLPGTKVTQYIRSGGYFYPKIHHKYSAWERFAFRWIPGYLRLHRYNILRGHDTAWSIKPAGRDATREQEEAELLAYLREKAPSKYLDVLTPNWPLAAKRPPLDNGWFDALHRDNVELVSSDLAEIDPTGITTKDGTHREHDVIVYATGADVAAHGIGVNVGLHGTGDQDLQQYWASIGGPQAYAGIAVPGFPNTFFVLGPNALACSWGYTLSRETVAIARIVRELVDYRISSVEPRLDVFEKENKEIQAELQASTLAADGVVNYWRLPNGRVTVNSPLSGAGLFWRTQWTRWADWRAERVDSRNGTRTKVNVVAIKRRQRALRLAVLALLGAALYQNWPRVVALAHEAAAYVL